MLLSFNITHVLFIQGKINGLVLSNTSARQSGSRNPNVPLKPSVRWKTVQYEESDCFALSGVSVQK